MFAIPAAAAPVKTLLVDLDGCLVKTNATAAIPFRVAQFAVRHLGFDQRTAMRECKDMYAAHGTNLEGFLQAGYDVDVDAYHAEVHGSIPYDAIESKGHLRRMLAKIPATKWVYTNADARHAERTLKAAGLDGVVDGVVCYDTLQRAYRGPFTACKPKAESVRLALLQAGADAETTVFFDDAPRNVRMGTDAGVRSVLVGPSGDCVPWMRLRRIEDIVDAFPLYFTTA